MTDLSPPSCKWTRLFWVPLLLATTTANAETWVFTNQAHPVSAPADARVVFIDEQHDLEEQLSQQLPADPNQATEYFQHYLISPEGKRLQNDLAKAQQGLTDAWSLGIEKIPAVVVDRRYVVYGEPDVAVAIQLINNARSAQQ